MELLIENNENINLYEYLNLNDFPYKERLFMNKYLRDINFKDESITKDTQYEKLNFHDVLSPKIETLLDEFHFNIAAIKEIADAAYDIYVSVVINKNLLDDGLPPYFEPKVPLKQLSNRDDERMVLFDIVDEYYKKVTFTTYQNYGWSIRIKEDDRPGFTLTTSPEGFEAVLLKTDGTPMAVKYTYNSVKEQIIMENMDPTASNSYVIDKDRYIGRFYLPLSFDYHITDKYRYSLEETPIEKIHNYIYEVDNEYDNIQTIESFKVGQRLVTQIDKVLDKKIIEIVTTKNENEWITEIFNPELSGVLAYDHKNDRVIYAVKRNDCSAAFYFKRLINLKNYTGALKVSGKFVIHGKKFYYEFPISLTDIPEC
ncbi:MAG: hypothetical protein MJ248_05240 [Bacilli bacterium]|nr:hypothetical protein [Bacilli bacterium]